ncbi:MAG: SUMF1/EgtB/PvdO family nonheme iron enzyme, partial [Treponemataceae bacterium]|nr:SUMF1/EgtB/PvdO family nonheme iron enzyme [Treponemataceae bacterium]
YSWLKDNSGGNTHEVGLKEPTPNGLYDMCGNVFVWCLDWYGTVEKGSVTDPVGAASGTKRVFRGYSKGSATPRAATGRLSAEQNKYFIDVGIRLCRTLK